MLPWDQAVKSITFYRDGKECDTIVLEEASPVVEMLAPKTADRRKEWLRVEWKATHATQPLTYLLRYSNDGGATWRGIASDLTETRTVVNLDLLPGGDRCLFQVAASAGIRTAVAETEPFAVPQKPRQAHILAPDPAAVFLEGQSVVLRGGGFSPDFGTTDFEDIVWSSQFDGVIGVGYEVITHTLSIGRHKIILSVPDGLGGETNASVFIEVKPRE